MRNGLLNSAVLQTYSVKQTNKLNKTSIAQHERVKAFKRKLKLWKTRASSGTTDMFEQSTSYQWSANPFTENIEEQLPATSPSILLEELVDLVRHESSFQGSAVGNILVPVWS